MGDSADRKLTITRFLNTERIVFGSLEEPLEVKRLPVGYSSFRATVATGFGDIDFIINIQRRFILKAEIVAEEVPSIQMWDSCFELLSSNYEIYLAYSAAFDEASALGQAFINLRNQDSELSPRVQRALLKLSLPMDRMPKYLEFLQV